MDEITSALQRIRVLPVQSQNGINSSSDRSALQKEVSALIADRDDYSVWRCENPCWEIFIYIPGRCQCRSEHYYQYFLRWRWIWRLRFEFGNYFARHARWRSAALTAIDNTINAIDAKRADWVRAKIAFNQPFVICRVLLKTCPLPAAGVGTLISPKKPSS